MCGIYGVLFDASFSIDLDTTQRMLSTLLKLSESRGKEASGIACLYEQYFHVYKAPFSSSKLARDEQYKQILTAGIQSPGPFVVLGHSRLATHGSRDERENNQPVVTQVSIGIHNGICTNYRALQKKINTQTPTADLDSEVLFSFLDQELRRQRGLPEALCRMFIDIEGSASIAYMHQSKQALCLATNTGSLHYIYKEGSYLIFASEAYMLQQLRTQLPQLELPDSTQLIAHHGAIFDLKNFSLNRFSLEKKPSPKKVSPATSATRYFTVHEHPYPSPQSTTRQPENTLTSLQQHQIDIKRIRALRRCARCILPETMPLIHFDQQGVCNYCAASQPIEYQGEDALLELVKSHRRSDGKPDCIVALSGGRDSAYGLHYIKQVLGMNPLAYTYDWGMITDIGRNNQARMVGTLGVEHVIVSADIQYKRNNIRRNILAWLEKPDLGMVPLFMAGDKQAEYYAQQLKKKTGIPLVIYCRGNELENEEFKWGHCGIRNGSPKGVLHNLSLAGKMQLASYYGTQFLKNPRYLNRSLIDTAFAYAVAYMMPLDFVYLWHYLPWDEETIISTLESEYHWERSPETGATWRIDDGSVAFYNYIFYAVQGFTENDTFRSNQVRHGHLSRAKALTLVEKENAPRYQSLKWYFDALELDGSAVLRRIDQIPKLYE